MHIYPLLFKPILKERIWGGSQLKTLFDKPLASDKTGERWKLSTVGNDQSIISNGIYSDKTFSWLLIQVRQEILAERPYKQLGTQLPLLCKFIDACDGLSILVHPNY